jgi:hypothetical protein
MPLLRDFDVVAGVCSLSPSLMACCSHGSAAKVECWFAEAGEKRRPTRGAKCDGDGALVFWVGLVVERGYCAKHLAVCIPSHCGEAV